MKRQMHRTSNFSKSARSGSLADMQAAQQAEANAQNAVGAASDAAVKAEWNFHNDTRRQGAARCPVGKRFEPGAGHGLDEKIRLQSVCSQSQCKGRKRLSINHQNRVGGGG